MVQGPFETHGDSVAVLLRDPILTGASRINSSGNRSRREPGP